MNCMRNVFRYVVFPVALVALLANAKDIKRYIELRSM
ncbi:MAG: DUF6893 family small protein [Burkholderiaceae bacterium]